MININSLSINNTSTSILVNVSTAVGFVFTKVLLWDTQTYRDSSKAIDLTSKLSQISKDENFTVLLSDIPGLKSFKGMFFLEFTSNETTNNIQTGLVANFIQYHECLMDKALSISVKNCQIQDSNCGPNNNILFISTLIESLYTAVLFELVEEAINMINTLDELCEVCHSCPDLGDAMLVEGLGFKTINNKVTPS